MQMFECSLDFGGADHTKQPPVSAMLKKNGFVYQYWLVHTRTR